MSELKRAPKKVRHLTLVPPLLTWWELPKEIRGDLDAILAAVEAKVKMQDIKGYTLWKERPEFITVVELFTGREYDIDLLDFPERVRLNDEYIDVMFRHYRKKLA